MDWKLTPYQHGAKVLPAHIRSPLNILRQRQVELLDPGIVGVEYRGLWALIGCVAILVNDQGGMWHAIYAAFGMG